MPIKDTIARNYDSVIALADAKAHLAADDIHDSIVTSIRAAAVVVAERTLQRSIADHTYQVDIKRLKRCIILKRPPVKSLTSVKYYDEDDVLQTIDSSNYTAELSGDYPSILFKSTYELPTLSKERVYPVQLNYTTGLSATDDKDDLIAFIKVIMGAMWVNRDPLSKDPNLDDLIKQGMFLTNNRRLFHF